MTRPETKPGGSGRRRLRTLRAAIAAAALALPATLGVTQASAASYNPFTSSPFAAFQSAVAPQVDTVTDGNDYSAYGQYGEVTRIGGYDSCWVKGSTYNGEGCATTELAPQAGLFVDPVGFAVDTSNNTIYVLDRISKPPTTTSVVTTWRLQELRIDSSGSEVFVASTTFSLNASGGSELQMAGLAVDPNTHIVYSLLETENSDDFWQPLQIDAWSSTPDSGTTILSGAATGLTASTYFTASTAVSPSNFTTAPGVLSNADQLSGGTSTTAGTTQLYDAEGLAIDNDGSDDDIAIEANTTTTKDSWGTPEGPVVVQPFAVAAQTYNGSSLNAGDPTPVSWSSSSLSATEAAYGAAGISTDPADNSLTVLLDAATAGGGDNQASGSGDNVEVVDLTSDLQTATVLTPASANPADSGGDNVDGDAIATSADDPPFANSHEYVGGPQIVGLSNGLYAADFGGQPRTALTGGDVQNPVNASGVVSSSGTLTKPFWFSGYAAIVNAGGHLASGNEGVRLLAPAADDGLLSNATYPVTSIYDTLGGTASDAAAISGTCSISQDATYAAGADGTLFALMQGEDSSYGLGNAGHQIIEFAPTSGPNAQTPASTAIDPDAGNCPTASGGFDVENTNATTPAYQEATDSTPLTVTVGDQVNFTASPENGVGGIDYPTAPLGSGSSTATPYQLTWYPEGTAADPESGPTVQQTMSSASGAIPTWPVGTPVTHTYDTPGPYEVTLVLDGDYGTYTTQGTIDVQTTNPPTAALSASSVTVTAGQSVTFDGSGSQPATGASISDYHWTFSDGTPAADTTTPTEPHTFNTAGTYTVTLTVRDNDSQQSSPVVETVTVNPAATVANNPPPTNTNTTTTTTKTTAPPVVKLSPANDVLKTGVTSASLVLQVKSLKSGTKLAVKLSEPGAHAARAKSAKVGADGVIRFATGKLPAGKTTIRFYETVGKGKKAKLKLVKTETVKVTVKKSKK